MSRNFLSRRSTLRRITSAHGQATTSNDSSPQCYSVRESTTRCH